MIVLVVLFGSWLILRSAIVDSPSCSLRHCQRFHSLFHSGRVSCPVTRYRAGLPSRYRFEFPFSSLPSGPGTACAPTCVRPSRRRNHFISRRRSFLASDFASLILISRRADAAAVYLTTSFSSSRYNSTVSSADGSPRRASASSAAEYYPALVASRLLPWLWPARDPRPAP